MATDKEVLQIAMLNGHFDAIAVRLGAASIRFLKSDESGSAVEQRLLQATVWFVRLTVQQRRTERLVGRSFRTIL